MQRWARCRLIAAEPAESQPQTVAMRRSGRGSGSKSNRAVRSITLLFVAFATLHIFLLQSSAAAATGANSSAPSIHTLGASILLDTIWRHNTSGQLPPLSVLNDMLREVNGEGAVRLDESFATASATNTAAAMNELMAGLDLTGAAGVGAGATGRAGFDWGAFTPPTFPAAFAGPPPFAGGPPPFPAATPSNLFSGAASQPATAAGAAGAAGAKADPSFGASGSSRNDAPKGSNNSDAADDGLPPLATKVDRALAQATCVLKFGMTDVAYGFFNVAAFQLAAVGQFVDVGGMNQPLRYILTGISNELRSIAYVFVGSVERASRQGECKAARGLH